MINSRFEDLRHVSVGQYVICKSIHGGEDICLGLGEGGRNILTILDRGSCYRNFGEPICCRVFVKHSSIVSLCTMGQNQNAFISLTNTLDREVYCVLSANLVPSELHTFS